MTIVDGHIHVFETWSGFRRHLDVDLIEMVEALDADQQQELLEIENTYRTGRGEEPVTDIADIDPDLVREVVPRIGLDSIVVAVLEAREEEYIHQRDGPFHRVAAFSTEG